jgi:hypothetical protein
LTALATSTGTGQYVAAENHLACFTATKAGARRGVLVHGGRTQTALGNMPPDGISQALAAEGIPVMYGDYSDGKTWGNDTGSTRAGQLWTYQKANFGAKTDKVCLYGASMGAATLLRWALANVSSVACFAGIIPALSLVDLHDNNRGGFAAEIETAHGVTGTYAGNPTITGRDPGQNAASYAFPIKLWYSGDDPTVVPATVAAFAAAAPNCSTVNMGNFGHAANPRYASDVATFLRQYA